MRLEFFLIIHLGRNWFYPELADRIINVPDAGKYIVMNVKH